MMDKKNCQQVDVWTIMVVFLLLGIMCGCAPVYVPNTVNVPLLGEKGQANVAATAGVSGVDLQGKRDEASGCKTFMATSGSSRRGQRNWICCPRYFPQ